jgi:YHS domain-containing protein
MDNTSKDPVCNKSVNKELSKHGFMSNYKSETYYFCSLDCKEKFDANPDRFIHKRHAMRGKL